MTNAHRVLSIGKGVGIVLALAMVLAASQCSGADVPSPEAKLRGNAAAAAGAAQPAVDDWPKWCGPGGDCTSREAGLLDTWPEGGPKKLWSQPAGQGFACPVAVDGRVYLFSTVKVPTTAPDGGKGRDAGRDVLAAYDAQTGRPLWSAQGDRGWTGGHPGTRATPTIEGDGEGGRVYTFGGMGDLICRRLADGKQLWMLDVMKETGGKTPMWGSASCPTIVGELIYVQVGKDGPVAVAVDKTTGKIAWQSQERGLGSYAAVVPIEVGGARQMLAFAGKAVVGMDPATGKTLWTQPWTGKYDIAAVSPVYRDGHLFLTSGYGREGHAAMFTFDGKKTEPLWQKPEPHDRFIPPLVEGEYFYVANDEEGSLICMHWPDGKEQWKSQDLRLGLGGQYVRFGGDKLILMSDRGTLMLLRATPAECKLISKVQLFTGSENWSTPLIYRGRLYVKGPAELVCFDIKAK